MLKLQQSLFDNNNYNNCSTLQIYISISSVECLLKGSSTKTQI